MDNHTPTGDPRQCNECSGIFDSTPENFYFRRGKPDTKCIGCRKKQMKRYYEQHSDEIKARVKDWQTEHADHVSSENQKRYQKNRALVLKRVSDRYQRKKTEIDIYRQQWRTRNNGKVKTQYQRREARKKGLPDQISAADWKRALDHFEHRCAVCGRPPGLWHTLAMDHWIPLANPSCPGTIPQNIVPLCHGLGGCNNLKGKQDPQTWLVKQYGVKKAEKIMARIKTYFDSL